MNDRTVLTNLLTENLVCEIAKALALPQTQQRIGSICIRSLLDLPATF